MSDQLHPIRVQLTANEILLYAVVIRLTQLDSGFIRDARRWVDHVFGVFSTWEPADKQRPEVISAFREEYLRLLERAEALAVAPIRPTAAAASASPKPKSFRRRIFEWLERG